MMASLFKVLGSEKRRQMLKLLKNGGMHISGLARALGISVPVALNHVKKLEGAGLVVRRRVGNTHLLYIPDGNPEKLSSLWMLLDEPLVLEAKKGSTLLDTLKAVPQIGIKRTAHGSYIASVDGKDGFFIYQIDGRIVDQPIDKCRLLSDAQIEIMRLIPALDRKIRIKVR